MSTVDPVVAGFDGVGDWHDGGNGRYARPGWSSAKSLAIRALRGAFAHDLSKANPDGVWLEAADDYLSRLGIAKGQAVRVRFGDAAHALIDAVHPDGQTRPVKVKWERFADRVPLTSDERWLPDTITRDLLEMEDPELLDIGRRLFDHDLGDGYTSLATSTDVEWKPSGVSLDVHGEIRYRGTTIGYWTRRIGRAGRDNDGAVVLINEIIGVAMDDKHKAHRGKGIGLRFVAASNAAAALAGADEVRVTAITGANTNGAYTWARAGYRWERDGKSLGERLLKYDPGNEVGRRLVEMDPADPLYPQPEDVARDPKGAKFLKGDDLKGPLGTVQWNGVLSLHQSDAERVEAPTVARNTTKGDLGRGAATAARIRDAGGTGQAIVADGYLARHGHPKGSTVTVTHVDDTYADVRPAEPGGRTIRTKWSRFTDDAPDGPAPDDAGATAIDLADWETLRPWEVQRDDSTLDPSDLLLHGERPPAWLRFESGHGQDAAHRGDHIVVTPKFFDLPEASRRATMYHEAGHGLSDRMLADGSAFDLMDKLPEWGNVNGQTTPGEIAAEAYAVLWTDPEWLDQNAPGLRDAVRAKAVEYGYPLPDVGVAVSPEPPIRDLVLDPDTSVETLADLLYNGTTPGGHRVTRRSATERTITSGPPHAPVTHRIMRFNADVYDDNPDFVDADGNPGQAHRFGHTITVAPGTDGEPHISVFLEGGGDDLWLDTDRYAEQIAERIGADQITSYSPTRSSFNNDVRDFIAEGWQFHPNNDRYTIRNTGVDLAYDHADIGYVTAWRDWDGRDVADIPQPQAILDDANISARSDAFARLSFLGIKSLTGRRAVPKLPREGGWVDWGDAANLPDGTLIEAEVDDQTRQYKVFSGRFVAFPAADAKTAAEEIERLGLGPGEGVNPKGQYPTQVTVRRYQAAPLPDVPPVPAAVEGVKAAPSTEPARPFWYPGQVVEGADLAKLPSGVRYRAVNDRGEPLDFDGGFDMLVTSQGMARPAHDDRYSTITNTKGALGRYMLTVVPAKPVGSSSDVGPMPDDLNVRVRNALVDTARVLKVNGGGVRSVEPFAAGAIHPADWVLGVGQNRDRRVAAPGAVLEAGRAQWEASHFPRGVGAEPYGPVWRVPGRSENYNVVWSTTPIEGVEPEVIRSSDPSGALADDHGILLFGRGSNTPIRWDPPRPSPLTDEQVAERLAAVGPPPPIALNTIVQYGDTTPDSPAARTRLTADWLANPSYPYSGMDVRRMQTPGPTIDGPTRTVRITTDETRGYPVIEKSPYVIGSPELDLAGWGDDDLVLPIEDPRLPAAIDRVWWQSTIRTGTVASIEAQYIAVGDATAIVPGDIDPKVARTLKSASNLLRSKVEAADGTIPIRHDGNRFVVAPGGTSVPSTDVHYLSADGDTTVVYVNRAAAAAVLGVDAVTPDYQMDPEWSWEEKVQHVAAQREKLLRGMPGATLDNMFVPPSQFTDRIETGEDPIRPVHTLQIERAQAVAAHGAAVADLVMARRQQIVANSGRDAEYRGGTDLGARIAPNHAKTLTKAIEEIVGSHLPVTGTFDSEEEARLDTNPTVKLLLRLVGDGIGTVSYRPARKPGIDSEQARLDSLARITIYGSGSTSGIQQQSGPWMEVTVDEQGGIHKVVVHPARKNTFSPRSVTAVEYAHDYVLPDEREAEQKLIRRLRRVAADIDNMSRSDPRPTLGELAAIETMEALGIDMGTDGSIMVGEKHDATTKLGRSTSRAAYAAQVGLNVYPRDWTATLPTQIIQFPKGDKYALGGGDNTGGTLIRVADPRKYPRHRDTVVHEFGHSMEASVPGLCAAEAWYLMHRVLDRQNEKGRVPVRKNGEIDGRDIVVAEGGFARPYAGRVYNESTIAGNTNYEVFTVAMESILNKGGDSEADQSAVRQVDLGLYQWVLGILTLIRPFTEEAK